MTLRPAKPRYADAPAVVLNITADAASIDLGKLFREARADPAPPSPASSAEPNADPLPPEAVVKRRPVKVYEPLKLERPRRQRDRVARAMIAQQDDAPQDDKGSKAFCR